MNQTHLGSSKLFSFNHQKRKSILIMALSSLFPFYILLSSYNILELNLCYWLFSPLIIAMMFKRKIKLNRDLSIFVTYIILIQIFNMILNRYEVSYQPIVLSIIFAAFSTFMVAGFSTYIDFNRMFKVYSFFCWICIVALFYQSFELYVLGNSVKPILLFSDYHIKDILLISNSRPSAFFNEPQHFASFITPFLVFSLEKNKKIWAFVVSLAILFSGSAQGIIIGLFVWGYYALVQKSQKRIIVLLLLVLIIAIVSNLSVFDPYINRIVNLDFNNELRIARGFAVYNDLPMIDKILGIGNVSVNDFIAKTGYGIEWYRDPLYYSMAYDFISSLSGAFLYYGFFGGLIFLLIMIKFALKSHETRCLVLVVLISAFSQTLLFNSWYVFYYSLIFILYNSSKKDIKKSEY